MLEGGVVSRSLDGVCGRDTESQMQQRVDGVTLLFSFALAFFCDGNGRWHFKFPMMATPQPRTIVLENLSAR